MYEYDITSPKGPQQLFQLLPPELQVVLGLFPPSPGVLGLRSLCAHFGLEMRFGLLLNVELSLLRSLLLVERVPKVKLDVGLGKCLRFYFVEVIYLIQFIGENVIQFRMLENVALLPEPALSLPHLF